MLNHFRRNNGFKRFFVLGKFHRIILDPELIEVQRWIFPLGHLNTFCIVLNPDRFKASRCKLRAQCAISGPQVQNSSHSKIIEYFKNLRGQGIARVPIRGRAPSIIMNNIFSHWDKEASPPYKLTWASLRTGDDCMEGSTPTTTLKLGELVTAPFHSAGGSWASSAKGFRCVRPRLRAKHVCRSPMTDRPLPIAHCRSHIADRLDLSVEDRPACLEAVAAQQHR